MVSSTNAAPCIHDIHSQHACIYVNTVAAIVVAVAVVVGSVVVVSKSSSSSINLPFRRAPRWPSWRELAGAPLVRGRGVLPPSEEGLLKASRLETGLGWSNSLSECSCRLAWQRQRIHRWSRRKIPSVAPPSLLPRLYILLWQMQWETLHLIEQIQYRDLKKSLTFFKMVCYLVFPCKYKICLYWIA